MATEIELGVYILLNIAGLSGFYAASRGWAIVLVLTAVIYAGLALYSFGGLEVVQTTHIQSMSANRTNYDAPGGNVTSFNEAQSAGYDTKGVVINSDFNTIGWLYWIAEGFALIWLIKVIVNMVQAKRGQIKAYKYWSSQ